MDHLIRAVDGVLRGIFREVARVLDSDRPIESAFEEDRIRSTDGEAAYSFKEEWKELLVYTESAGTYTFLCGWGDFKRPFSVGVPTAEHWDNETPAWMHGRRDEILDRLRHWAGAKYVIDEYVPAPKGPKPWVSVIGARYAERPDLGKWLAILMDPGETTPPDLSWAPELRRQFFDDHAGRIGGGPTPDEAVDDLRRRVGQPDLRWGT